MRSRLNTQGDRDGLLSVRAMLAGRYDVQARVGGGGAADVYMARDIRSGSLVAVKVYRSLAADGIGAERFLREIEVTARLEHPNILPVIESGADNGQLYYVMPYAADGTLADLMARQGPVPVLRACHIVRDLAGALSYAHQRGIVHRDIKPDNVMLMGDTALLADFGIAKPLGAAQLSVAGVPLGTPDFMAPEQVLSHKVDGRTDIYSLGALMYEMVTGEPLFPRDNAMQVMAAHVDDEVPDPTRIRPDLPKDLTLAIRKCLEKEPDDRWQDMIDLGNAIAAVERRSQRQSDRARTSDRARLAAPFEPRPSLA